MSFSPIAVDVIVDTWNLRKQSFDVLGAHRFPGVPGIISGLEAYGFAVQHVYAAVACEPYSDNPSVKVTKALQTTSRFVQSMNGSTQGTLLKGRLTDRSGELEEKLVDVLCAVQITRSAMEIATNISQSEAIVVVSEDIDLTPAYEMARQLGVPVYAAANETVDTRPGDWLILSDATLVDFCGRPFGDAGATRKTTVAKQLLSGQLHRQFEFGYVDHRSKDIVFRHRTGVEGSLPANEATARYRSGQRVQLYPVDLLPAHAGSDFPRLRLSVSRPVADRPPYLIDGHVHEWVQPTRVRVRKPDGTIRAFDAAPGTLLPGMEVALYHAPGSRSRLVGALEKMPMLDGWTSPTTPKIATAQQTATSPGATVRASIDGLSAPVALLPSSETQVQTGDSFAVVPRDQEGGRVTKVLAVSTALRRRTLRAKT